MTEQYDDPLRHADVGETVTVRRSVDLHTAEVKPSVFYGTDRFGDGEVDAIKVAEDEYGDEVVRIAFKGDLTKALPPRWDHVNEPLTDSARRSERRRRWGLRLAKWGSMALVFAVAGAIAHYVMQGLTDLTINGEPMQPLTLPETAGLIAVLYVLVLLVDYVLEVVGSVHRGGRR